MALSLTQLALLGGVALVLLVVLPVLIPLTVTLLVAYFVWHVLSAARIRKSQYMYTRPADVAGVPESEKKKKSVCVIGAGPAGLVTVKELIQEGHDVTCYEKLAKFGGVFLYDTNRGGVYDACVLTIGNYLMAFSDCFIPGDKYRFWKHTEYYDYLCKYVQQFQLEQKAKFNYQVEVKSVERLSSGKWKVETSKETKEFDCVAVCNGAHQVANIPKIPGQETSKIKICHSETFKRASGDPRFEGKRVCLVGIGETGADMAYEVPGVASKSFLSMGRTPHIVPRNIWNRGYPGDAYSSRPMFYINHAYLNFLHDGDQDLKAATGNSPFFQKLFKGYMGIGDPRHAKVAEYAKRSGGLVAEQFLTKNDQFIDRVLEGSLTEKPLIDRLEGDNTVVFKDGSREEVDTILLSTGYVDSFPFLKGVKFNSVRDLYKHAFHPDIGPSLAFVGFVRPGSGGVPACAEILARYFALLCSETRTLPKDINERIAYESNSELSTIKISAKRVKTLVMYGDYMESLAMHVGCAPNLISFLFKDPALWLKLAHGVMAPLQFRLKGPHAQPEFARECIMHIPIAMPIPFVIAQSVCITLGWILGSLFNIRPTSW